MSKKAIIFKDEPVTLFTKDGNMLSLSGHLVIDYIEESLFNAIRSDNPIIDRWIDEGYLLINNNNIENVTADKHLEEVKKDERRNLEAERKAVETIKKATKKA